MKKLKSQGELKMKEETCVNCGRIISVKEQAYVHKNNIVCQSCYCYLSDLKQAASSSKSADFKSAHILPTQTTTVSYHREEATSVVLGILGILSWIIALIISITDSEDKAWFWTSFISYGLGAAALSFGWIAKRGLRAGSNYQYDKVTVAGIFMGIIVVVLNYISLNVTIMQKNDPILGMLVSGFILFVWGSQIWVGVDSSDLMKNISEEQANRIFSLAPRSGSWLTGCVLFWILAFPCYLFTRCKYIRFQRQSYLRN
jgi:hypothetical protein